MEGNRGGQVSSSLQIPGHSQSARTADHHHHRRSRSSGAGSGGTCGACGSPGSSRPQSWGRSLRRLEADTVLGSLGGTWGRGTWEGAGIAAGSAGRTSRRRSVSLDTFKEKRSVHKLQASVSPVNGLTRAYAPNPSCLLGCDVQEKSGNGSQVQLTWQDSSLTLYSFPEPCCHPLSWPCRNTEGNTPHWEVTRGGYLWVHVCFRMKRGGGPESHVSQTPMPPTQVLAHCPLPCSQLPPKV